MNMQEELKKVLLTSQGILAAGIAVGFGCIGLGIAIFGMSSCEARSVEARTDAQIENIRDRRELYKWQLENGHMTPEEWREENKSPLLRLLEN